MNSKFRFGVQPSRVIELTSISVPVSVIVAGFQTITRGPEGWKT